MVDFNLWQNNYTTSKAKSTLTISLQSRENIQVAKENFPYVLLTFLSLQISQELDKFLAHLQISPTQLA